MFTSAIIAGVQDVCWNATFCFFLNWKLRKVCNQYQGESKAHNSKILTYKFRISFSARWTQ